MNETLSTLATRYSCRAYDGRLPEKDKLEQIALAAVQSPSGLNRQPWQIIVITEKNFIEEMDADGMRIVAGWEDQTAHERYKSRGGSLFYNAPVMFLILKQPGTELDCGIVSQNIALAAHALGLGNVICGMANVPLSVENGERYKQKIGFPKGYEFGMSVLVGYAKEAGGKPHEPDIKKIRFL